MFISTKPTSAAFSVNSFKHCRTAKRSRSGDPREARAKGVVRGRLNSWKTLKPGPSLVAPSCPPKSLRVLARHVSSGASVCSQEKELNNPYFTGLQ